MVRGVVDMNGVQFPFMPEGRLNSYAEYHSIAVKHPKR
jgi:hypothetical protein